MIPYYYNSENANASYDFGFRLRELIDTKKSVLSGHPDTDCQIIILCIGSDRSTGDSLGPLIGYKLSKISFENVYVYGTLSSPIHALNLCDVLSSIYAQYTNPLIIAIDAALGSSKHIGFLTLSDNSIIPGQGIGKSLPLVGDVSITGIVGVSGALESIRLSSTRLAIVMSLADSIVTGIRTALICS